MLILSFLVEPCEDILMSEDSYGVHILFCNGGSEFGVGMGGYCRGRVGLMLLVMSRAVFAIIFFCGVLLDPVIEAKPWPKKALI
jgi:hypothetical protein